MCSVIRDRAGQLWHLYAQKTDTREGWDRDICLDPVSFDEHGLFSGTPTRGLAQPVPVCDPSLAWSPDFHPRGAVFSPSVSVALTSNTAGAEIRYTLNGSDPTESSPRYDQPFTLTKSVTVKARAFKSGLKTSAVSVARFTLTSDPLPANPSPNAPPGHPPFEVFPQPVLNWQPSARKPQE